MGKEKNRIPVHPIYETPLIFSGRIEAENDNFIFTLFLFVYYFLKLHLFYIDSGNFFTDAGFKES